MEQIERKQRKQTWLAAAIWLLVLLLLGGLCVAHLSGTQRREQLALLGRLLPLYKGQEEELLAAVMRETADTDAEIGRELLALSSYASRGYRELCRTDTIPVFILGWCGLTASGLLLLFLNGWRAKRRCREIEALGESLFLWKPQTPELKEPEILYMRDCLERQREQLEKEQKAQRAEQEKQTRYLENLFHQIKTPLAGISLCHDYLEVIETEPQKQELLTKSRVQINHIESLVRQLLLLARLDAGRATMKLERVVMEELLERVRQVVSGLGEEKQLKISWRYEESELVLCDCFWIQEVLINLLKNAIEHTPEQGRIEIWTEEASPGVDIHIRDTGSGVPAAEREQIFRRFYTEASAENGRNTGIGLNLAYEIVLKHGGLLELLDHEGTGAWFRLRLYG